MLNRKWKIRAISFLFVGAAGFIFYKVGRSAFAVTKIIREKESLRVSEKNEFSDVVYTSFDENLNKITLKSSKVKETNNEIFDFDNMATTFNISQEETATIFADKTRFVSKDSKQCEMIGNVKLSTEEGLLLETEKSFVDIDKKFACGNTDIRITQDDTKFFAKKYQFDMGKKVVTLMKNVNGNISGDLITADKLVVEFDKVIGKDLKKVHAFGNSSYKTSQYDLRATKDIIYTKEHAEANGNVNLDLKKDKRNYFVESEHMTVEFQKNVIKKVIAQNNLKIKIDNMTSIKGNHGVLAGDFLTVTGNTVISNEKGKILCKKAILNTKTNDIKVYDSKGIIKRN